MSPVFALVLNTRNNIRPFVVRREQTEGTSIRSLNMTFCSDSGTKKIINLQINGRMRQFSGRSTKAIFTKDEFSASALQCTLKQADAFLLPIEVTKGPWLWRSWQSNHFRHLRSPVRSPTSAKKMSECICPIGI